MNKKNIIIITGTGGIYGTGHIQRMLNLAIHLNSRIDFTASIYLKQNEYPLSEKFKELLINSIPPDTDLIIHDMRDSSVEEMQILKQTAPVLTIDDSGPGQKSADYAVNLLPVPSEVSDNIKPETSLFLYGYNFTEGIGHLQKNKFLKKDIDIAVYAGYDPPAEIISLIRKSIPEYSFSILLADGRAILLTGETLPSGITYAEVITRTRIVITHFGLTMFEAHACGCKIAALDPTAYHKTLTETVSSEFNILYSSEYKSLSTSELYIVLQNELKNYTVKNISAENILKKINSTTENFIKYINTICNNSRMHN